MPQSSGPVGKGDATWQNNDDWPQEDRDWQPSGPGGPRPRRGGMSPLTVGLVAVIVAALGIGAGLVVEKAFSSSQPSASSGNSPAVLPPQGGGGPVVPPGGAVGGGGGGGGRQLLMMGTVTAVSGKSITLSAQGHTVTAEITSSTQITDKGDSVAGIKVGDTVSAQISEGSTTVATGIQDPPGLP